MTDFVGRQPVAAPRDRKPASPPSGRGPRQTRSSLGAQARLVVGASSDPLERQADAIADEVVATLRATSGSGGSTAAIGDAAHSRIQGADSGDARGSVPSEPGVATGTRIRRAGWVGAADAARVAPRLQRRPMVQRRWLDSGSPKHTWDAPVRGVQWFREKGADAFSFELRSESAFLVSHDKSVLSQMAARQGEVKARREWVALLGGAEDAVPKGDADVDVVVSAPSGGGTSDLDVILDPYLNRIPDTAKKDALRDAVRAAVGNLRAKSIDAAAIVRTLSTLGVKVEEDNKMYCVENVLNGLAVACDNRIPFAEYIVKSLVVRTDRSLDIANAVAYGKAKDRMDATTFETVFKGVVFDIKRNIPRGFNDELQFREFSRDYRGLLNPYGTDIAVQGSAAVDIAGTVKDIDIAVLRDAAGFNKVLAEQCIDKSKALWKVLVAIGRKTGAWNRTAISDADVTAGVDAIRTRDGRITMNAEMASIEYCHSRGVWKNSDFLTKAEKKTRDELDKKWMPALGLLHKMDLSVIKRGGDFDKAPYLDLAR